MFSAFLPSVRAMLLEQKFRDTIKKFRLLKKNDRVIVAVSGGPDSVCLLVLLSNLKRKLNLYLHVATFNHLIRGGEARRDVEFVKEISRRFNLGVTAGEGNVPEFAKLSKLSLEEAGRFARFSFLKEVARKNRAGKIALGHNLDDQIETFLMRLMRGAGLAGLCGMAPKRKEDHLELIRPLIEISRQDLEAFLGKKKLKFRVDKTNQSRKYLRNKVRLSLIPLLEKKYNPRIKEVILRTTHNIKEGYEFLEREAELKAKESIYRKGAHIFLRLENLEDLPWIIKTYILKKALFALKGNLRQLTLENWLALQKLAFELQSGKRLSLPGGITVRKVYHNLIFEGKTSLKEIPPSKRKEINCPGSTRIQKLGIEIFAKVLDNISRHKKESKWVEFFDADKIKGPLFVRTRKEKDVFRPLGMRGRKTLKKFFIDEKIPLLVRSRVPIIEDNQKIMWVVGSRISDEVKVTQKTKHILKLEVKKI